MKYTLLVSSTEHLYNDTIASDTLRMLGYLFLVLRDKGHLRLDLRCDNEDILIFDRSRPKEMQLIDQVMTHGDYQLLKSMGVIK
jgi:hypothetical protein